MKTRNDRLLRLALLGDGDFEIVCGLVCIVASNWLVAVTKWQIPALFVIGGVALISVAVLLYWMMTRPQVNHALSRMIAALNLIFAAVGLLIVIAFWSALADGAHWVLSIVAAGVGIFGLLEALGLRTARSV